MHTAEMVALARSRWPHVEIHCPPVDEAVARLADDIAMRLREAIEARGQAVLCVSGGKSPVALFEALRALPLAWPQLTVTLVDERCVPPEHPDSNARLVRAHLLQGAAAQARFVPWIDTPNPVLADAAAQANARMAALPVPDVLVLGMGADGHTASLFPHSPDLAAALDLATPACVLAVRLPEPPPQPSHPRLTMTLAHILRARRLVLPVQGDDKLRTLAQAAADTARPHADALPISHILDQATTPVSLWLPQ
ncbi:6-phosphogluconolactonase [uncultured Aquabacterium sp.]|uniref:6-phosphogluconolactonase n=1 Tax=uncultured Aquabacterium sp. TaxID=158753 RepID=UPI0030D54ABC